MQRVHVVGNSGSGKSTLAAELAIRLGVPHIELDAHFHLPGWVERDKAEFAEVVARELTGVGWVVDGNYSSVLDIVWERADAVVWLDYRRPVVMARMIRRTLSRAITRRELWNGNRESWRGVFSLRPERSIIAWAWTRHATYHQRYAELLAPDVRPPGMTVVRLASPAEARIWLGRLP